LHPPMPRTFKECPISFVVCPPPLVCIIKHFSLSFIILIFPVESQFPKPLNSPYKFKFP
jgi:hypothetical protein